MQIVFFIDDTKVQRVVAAINGLYPMPSELEETMTPVQWAKEKIRRFMVAVVFRYEQKAATEQALGLIVQDDDLVTILTATPLTQTRNPLDKGAN